MGEHGRLIRQCVIFAWRGSISVANAWAPFVGAIVLWVLVKIGWLPVTMPEGWLGLAEVSFMCLGASWALIFLSRLISAPYFMHLETMKSGLEKTSLPDISFGLMDSGYETIESLPDGMVRRWASVIVRNASDVKAAKVTLYAEIEKFHNRYTGTERFVISGTPLVVGANEEKIIQIASRDETNDEEFIQRGGDITLNTKSEFGKRISQICSVRLQAVISSNVVCEAIFTLEISATGRLIIHEAYR